MHQQNGSFAQNVDSEDIPGSTNGVNKKARNNKLYGDRAPPTSTNVLIYKMGWPPRLQFLAPFHISCNPDINKVGNRSYMLLCLYAMPSAPQRLRILPAGHARLPLLPKLPACRCCGLPSLPPPSPPLRQVGRKSIDSCLPAPASPLSAGGRGGGPGLPRACRGVTGTIMPPTPVFPSSPTLPSHRTRGERHPCQCCPWSAWRSQPCSRASICALLHPPHAFPSLIPFNLRASFRPPLLSL